MRQLALKIHAHMLLIELTIFDRATCVNENI